MSNVINRAIVTSISLTSQEKEWLDDMELSPTALIKQKIMEMMTNSMAQRRRVLELETNITKLQDRLAFLYEFMDKQKLLESLAIYEKQKGII
jgi:hypothetical protein